MAFDNRLKYENYCDNFIYKKTKTKQVPKFDDYNITAKLNMIYKHIIKYLNLLFFKKHNRLLTTNLTKTSRLMIK